MRPRGENITEGRVYSRVGIERKDDGHEGWNMPQMLAEAELLKQQLWTSVDARWKGENLQP